MIRFLILSGYFELMMYLQVTGKLNQYINVHYRYLAILSMVLSLVLALVQLVIWVKGIEHNHEDGHHHRLDKWYQKLIAYVLLSLPLAVGMLFPTITLDSTIVEAKGFNFPVSKESVGDPEMNTQYLKPDTSIYYNDTDYSKMMEKLLDKYEDKGEIKVTDKNYLEIMEIIYNYPSIFQGKKISYTGFVFQAPKGESNEIFAFRFGIIHCVADSGVFGLMAELPEGAAFENNDWIHVEGKISTTNYEPMKTTIPCVLVDNVKKVSAPGNEYVYRSF